MPPELAQVFFANSMASSIELALHAAPATEVVTES